MLFVTKFGAAILFCLLFCRESLYKKSLIICYNPALKKQRINYSFSVINYAKKQTLWLQIDFLKKYNFEQLYKNNYEQNKVRKAD
jgi:hypothetical protein